MAYNQEYPYVDAQMFNIDWVLAKIKELEQAINVDAYKYIGENVYTDWNQAQPQTITYIPVGSLALNQAMEGSSGMLFTNGTPENLEQRFYAFSSGDMWYRSARNGVWLMWSNKDDNSSFLKGLSQSSVYNANNAIPNTYIYAYASPTNFPSGVSAGLCINYKTLDNGLLQAVYPTVGTDSWKRIKTNDGVWGQWINVNDYTDFFKRISSNQIINLDNMPGNSYGYFRQGTTNTPTPYGFVIYLTNANNNRGIQIVFQGGTIGNEEKYYRYNEDGWSNWFYINENSLHSFRRSLQTQSSINDFPQNTYTLITSNTINDRPFNITNFYILTFNIPDSSAVMQIAYNWSSGIYYFRRKEGAVWSQWYNPISGTNSAMLSANYYDIYAQPLSKKYNILSTEESTKGSSFMHADTGYESFADAILRRELKGKDMVVTNLEMWDMDTPVNELTAKVSEVVTHIKETSPLTEFTLYSLPPIDVPFFGDELYTYEWPSGNTLTEVDEALLALAQEMDFKYITWREYKHINDNNLLSLYDDLFNNDLYKHSLQSYIETTI